MSAHYSFAEKGWQNYVKQYESNKRATKINSNYETRKEMRSEKNIIVIKIKLITLLDVGISPWASEFRQFKAARRDEKTKIQTFCSIHTIYQSVFAYVGLTRIIHIKRMNFLGWHLTRHKSHMYCYTRAIRKYSFHALRKHWPHGWFQLGLFSL